MTDAVAIVGSITGLVSGYIYQFVLSIAMGIASGDKDEIVRVCISLVAVWLSFVILIRSSRLIAHILKTAIKLALLTACFVVALQVYNRGLEPALTDAQTWVRDQLPDLATVSSTVSLYEGLARRQILVGIGHIQDHVVSQFARARTFF